MHGRCAKRFDAAVAEHWLIKHNMCSTDNEAAFREEEASAHKSLPRWT